MMKSATKKLTIPSLADRIEAIKEEASAALDHLSELHRPPSVPAGWLRQNWLARGGGSIFEAYLAAAKELGL